MPAIDPERSHKSGHGLDPGSPDEAGPVVDLSLAAPLVLITIELFHPANFTVTPGMTSSSRMPSTMTRRTRLWAISDPSGGSRCT